MHSVSLLTSVFWALVLSALSSGVGASHGPGPRRLKGDLQTNAKRLQQGLPPLAPRRLFSPSKVQGVSPCTLISHFHAGSLSLDNKFARRRRRRFPCKSTLLALFINPSLNVAFTSSRFCVEIRDASGTIQGYLKDVNYLCV